VSTNRLPGLVAVALILAAPVLSLAHGVTIVVSRERSTPESVEIVQGDEVHCTNASGGIAHVWFAGAEGIEFNLGTSASHVRFDRPGTYKYTVHIRGGTKPHAHTGTIVVKPR